MQRSWMTWTQNKQVLNSSKQKLSQSLNNLPHLIDSFVVVVRIFGKINPIEQMK